MRNKMRLSQGFTEQSGVRTTAAEISEVQHMLSELDPFNHIRCYRKKRKWIRGMGYEMSDTKRSQSCPAIRSITRGSGIRLMQGKIGD